MERGNVLVIGNSGVGKSTLINATLGEERAKTGRGTEGTTNQLEIYESDIVPFRIIDTVGFEPSYIKEYKAIHAVKSWSKECAKNGQKDHNINVIWFCIDGTSSKLFPEMIKNLSRATSMWESVPIVVVITKSYSTPEREQNIEMVSKAFAKQKGFSKNLAGIIPVVASTYVINDSAFAAPDGIIDLIESTNRLMPEGIRAGERDVYKFTLKRKKALAQGLVGASTTAAFTVGAVPIPFADAALLTPLEVGEINGLAQIYEISKNQDSKQFLNSIVEVGTVGVAVRRRITIGCNSKLKSRLTPIRPRGLACNCTFLSA